MNLNSLAQKKIEVPDVIAIAATRAMLGVGLGLLLAPYFRTERRRQFGWTLFGVGALSTLPLALDVFRQVLNAPPPGHAPLEVTAH